MDRAPGQGAAAEAESLSLGILKEGANLPFSRIFKWSDTNSQTLIASFVTQQTYYCICNSVFCSVGLYGCYRLRNDLLCVEWDVKPYTLTHYVVVSALLLVWMYILACIFSRWVKEQGGNWLLLPQCSYTGLIDNIHTHSNSDRHTVTKTRTNTQSFSLGLQLIMIMMMMMKLLI